MLDVEAEDQLRKIGLRIAKQKKVEEKLKREVQQVFGSEELALEKQVQFNSLNDEVAILQRQYDAAKAEE
jgi:polyhydroxyalkanoate synthesis regulator phasin